MEKFKLAVGLHNHQPVGNFQHVFEEAHQKAYLPFIKLFEKFEPIRISLHQSGILWDWQEKNHPDYLAAVKSLADKGRLEIMTGGFYEPIIPSIPDRDKKGQIALLNKYIQEHFGIAPRGCWLTERVWEPHLPKILHDAGVEYVPVDDTHFIYAGFEYENLRGVFVTENDGAAIRILPIQKKLRYLIPFKKVDFVIGELRAQAERNPGGLAVYADDGEKFGVWPKTHQHCFVEGWLEQFFTALCANSDWLEVIPLAEAARTPSLGIAYLPTASYAEMLHWSLPTRAFVEYEEFEGWLKQHGQRDRFGRFVRGGHWRGFLHKYPEANLMHKKMLSVSERLDNFETNHPDNIAVIEKARHHLYAGQCNCPYWHGVFGGLYLPHLRQAVYEQLLLAERLLLENEGNPFRKEEKDYDCDGHPEIVMTTPKFVAVIKPSRGGSLLELDCLEGAFNLSDTLSRRREGYHGKLAGAQLNGTESTDQTESIHDIVLTKEKGLDKFLAEDWYLRRGYIDHFFGPQVDIDSFLSGQFRDEGDFVLEPYTTGPRTEPGTVILRRKGHLWRPEGPRALEMEKRYYFGYDSDVISVSYAITASNEDIPDIRLAVESNYNFQAGHSDDRYILFDGEKIKGGFLDSTLARRGCQTLVIRDDFRNLAVALATDREAEIWQAPIFTISLSEGGFEKVYQGTSLVHIFPAYLKKGVPFEITFLMFAGNPAKMPPRFIRAGRIGAPSGF